MELIKLLFRSVFIYAGSVLILGMFFLSCGVQLTNSRPLTLLAIPMAILVNLLTRED